MSSGESKASHALGEFQAPRSLAEIASEASKNHKLTEALRAVIAGGGAARLLSSSVTLFEAGGKHILDEGARKLVREAAERGATSALAVVAGPLMVPAKVLAERPIGLLASTATKTVVRTTAKQAARFAGKAVLKGAGRAAGIGLAIDGAVAGVEAVVAVRAGTMTKKTAVRHVATEAATGAVATGAGVLIGAGLVALTGGAAAPVVFAVGALGSIGTKRLLSRLIKGAPMVAPDPA